MFAIDYAGGVGVPVPVHVVSRVWVEDGDDGRNGYIVRSEDGKHPRILLQPLFHSASEAYDELIARASRELATAEDEARAAHKRLTRAQSVIQKLAAAAKRGA